MLLVLMAPALWNGFPIVFPDTGGYLMRPIEGTLGMGRSALYGWFLYAGLHLAFWPVIVAQAAVTAWIIALTLRCHDLGGRPWLALGVTVALSMVTSLAWVATQLIPDILFPLAVLALHLLMFRLHALKPLERLALVALIAVAIACHMAALALCIGLIAALWLISLVKPFALPRPRLGLAAGAAGAGIALCLFSNLAITGNFAFTPGGISFLFGRLVEDGIVRRYAYESCPDPSLRLCAYANNIPDTADDWLWKNDTAFYKLGGWQGFSPEATRIILDSIKRYPLSHLTTAINDIYRQFTGFQTEVSIDDNEPAYNGIRDYAPELMPQLNRARQQAERFDIAPFNRIHVPAGALAIAGVVAVLLMQRWLMLSAKVRVLCVGVLFALVINATICAVFSHAVDRYQSRMVPLAFFALAIAVCGLRRHPP